MPFDSPNPFADPEGPSLAGLITVIEGHAEASPRARREICSALRSLAKWFNLPPSAVPANRQHIRQKLARFHPLQAGVSERRLQNVRSLTSRAFRLAGLPGGPASYLCPLIPEWRALYDLLPSPYAAWGLSRLMRYLSARRIPPAEVSDVVFDEFKSALIKESLVAHPVRDHQTACRLWNQVRREVDERPLLEGSGSEDLARPGRTSA